MTVLDQCRRPHHPAPLWANIKHTQHACKFASLPSMTSVDLPEASGSQELAVAIHFLAEKEVLIGFKSEVTSASLKTHCSCSCNRA